MAEQALKVRGVSLQEVPPQNILNPQIFIGSIKSPLDQIIFQSKYDETVVFGRRLLRDRRQQLMDII